MKRLVWILLIVLLFAGTGIDAQEGERTPPQDYSEVEEQYTAMEAEAVTEGEAVVDLFLSEDFATLYERLTHEVQTLVTEEQLEQIYGQITGVAPIDERVDYRVLGVAGSMAYISVHTWGEQLLGVTTMLNADDAISGLSLQPYAPLPDDPAEDFESSANFHLPFDGLWYVFWGGENEYHNYHVTTAPQRHAYDFLVWQDGSTFTGDGTAPEDYYAYGQPVLSPADGTVITIVDGLPDMLPQVETDAANPAGNHVVIEVGEEEYLFIAHMQPDSIEVEEGDTVTAGQMIGLCGNSGNTSEPHIHIHLQDQPEMFITDEDGEITGIADAIGLPIQFSNILVNGEPVEVGEPVGGQFAQQQAAD